MQKYGLAANGAGHAIVPCLVCDDPDPRYSWTDYSGEGYCLQCGTPYQLQWGTLKEGESYPRLNLKADVVQILRRYWSEAKRTNGLGTFMIERDYPDQIEGRIAFNEWYAANKDAQLP